MMQATGTLSNLTLMLTIVAVLLIIGVGALFLALFGKRRWRPSYRLEVIFVAILAGLGVLADVRSSDVYSAYEAKLPTEALSGKDWNRELEKLGSEFDRVFRVYAYQWGFTFIDENDAASRNAVKVKAGETILFAIMSNDVIHGFNIPASRIITEFEPPNVRAIWIRAPELPGKYLIQCTNYCGLGHAQMKAWLVVGGEHEETVPEKMGDKDHG
jgi:heme/copper-type cytochrome/quinol oxidase subunit 2